MRAAVGRVVRGERVGEAGRVVAEAREAVVKAAGVRAMAAGTGLRTAKLCKYLIKLTWATPHIYMHISFIKRAARRRAHSPCVALSTRATLDASHDSSSATLTRARSVRTCPPKLNSHFEH